MTVAEQVEPIKNIDPRAFRDALGQFLTGVTVVTTHDAEDRPRGMTANSFTSVSLDPALVLVCIGKYAGSFEAFRDAGSFAVNVLTEEQEEISNLFASKRPDKFEHAAHRSESTGAAIIEDCLCWLDCETHQVVDAGDHIILIGRVIDFDSHAGRPLGYWRGTYVRFGLEDSVDIKDEVVMLGGCIAEKDGRVAMCRDQYGNLSIPVSKISQHQRPRAQIEIMLSQAGVDARLVFLYSVFDSADKSRSYLVYRGEIEALQGRRSDQIEFFDAEDMPWDEIGLPEIRSMLERYFHESSIQRFSIYVDSPEGGQLAELPQTDESGRRHSD